MKYSNLDKIFNPISNSWIIGCSILSCTIMTLSYLNGINDISFLHFKRKFRLELQQIEKSIDLKEKIIKEDKLISYYSTKYNIIFITGISGLTIIIFHSFLKK